MKIRSTFRWSTFRSDKKIAVVYLAFAALVFILGNVAGFIGFRGIANMALFWSIWLFLVGIYFAIFQPCRQKFGNRQPR